MRLEAAAGLVALKGLWCGVAWHGMAGPAGGMTVRDAGHSAAALRDRRLDGRAFVMGGQRRLSNAGRALALAAFVDVVSLAGLWHMGAEGPNSASTLRDKSQSLSLWVLWAWGAPRSFSEGEWARVVGRDDYRARLGTAGIAAMDRRRRRISVHEDQGDRCPRCGLTSSAAQVDDGHGRVQAGPSRLLHLSHRAPAAVCHPRPADGPADSPLATADGQPP